MCDKEGVTDEHVPPKCLFPELKDLPQGIDLRKNLITVPSCEDHNSRKSKDDEYLLYCLVFNLPANSTAEKHFLSKIMRAIDRNPYLALTILKKNIPILANNTETGEWFETVGVSIDTNRLYYALECMARALFFHNYQRQWHHAVRVEPEFMLAIGTADDRAVNDKTEKIRMSSEILFSNVPHNGENPEVFTYQIYKGEFRLPFAMRLHFYGRCRATIYFCLEAKNAL